MNDTIYALSSGALPSGVAIVRISGPDAIAAATVLTGAPPEPRKAVVRTVRGSQGEMIDQALVLLFTAPASFTGEDCIELHLHGSRAVVAAVFNTLETMPNIRLAEAGEFTRRAFENGKLDLVEAEALADLVAAETEMQRRLAIEQSFGGQSALYLTWATRLTRARALIEAELDFADEDDVPGSVSEKVWADIGDLLLEIEEHLADAKAGEIVRDGYKVAITGPPNAGKSSLLNALAKRDVAIVTEIAGTTRDVLHVDLDIEGYLVRFFDTAGVRDTDDVVEREGVRRALETKEQADLVLHLEEIDSQSKHEPASGLIDEIRIGTKLDKHERSPGFDLCLSTKTGEGLPELRQHILTQLTNAWSGGLVPGRQRHVHYLKEASQFIQDALNGSQLDVRAENLRTAAASLGRITGRVDVEELLDVIFSQFCIGK
jgi:tRNA modification GTPase